MALPTSTRAEVTQSRRLPKDANAVVVFCTEAKPAAKALTDLGGDLGQAVAALLTSVRDAGGKGKLNSTLHSRLKRVSEVSVVGLGAEDKLTSVQLRDAGGAIAKHARRRELANVALVLPAFGNIAASDAAQAITEGFLIASFQFREYRSKDKDKSKPIARLQIVSSERIQGAIDRGRIIAEAQNFARTIAFRPGNNVNPLTLEDVCRSAAREAGLKIRVLDENQMRKLKMGGMLAVGAGSSATPPRMIVLEYLPAGVRSDTVLLVGKAITFDTGGISIKPSERMGRMIFDKCGGMAVLGAMVAVARLKLKRRVVGILPSAENHISERAYRPGDILRMYNGVTVEVTNTDAEGRLVLGDAMAWGIEQYKPSACIDLATLTGGVLVALGRNMAGIMGTDQALVDKLIAVGKAEGEKMWQLPVPEEPGEMLKSEFADIVNSAGRDAHPLQGAAFLSHFLPENNKPAWAHLDIAGVADTDKETPLYSKGATGWGVRTLVRWLSANDLPEGRKGAR